MTISLGEIGLGKIRAVDENDQEVWSYQLTQDDLLWAGRMLAGEEGDSDTDLNYRAVLWCLASRLYSFRGRFSSFKDLCKGFSQPINPKWRTEPAEPISEDPNEGSPTLGSKFRERAVINNRVISDPSKTEAQKERARRVLEQQPARNRRRIRTSTRSWGDLPNVIKIAVKNFSEGNSENPVPGAFDFALHPVAVDSLRRRNRNLEGSSSSKRWLFLWNSDGLQLPSDPLDDLYVGNERVSGDGNTYIGTNESVNWPPNFIRTSYENNESSTNAAPNGLEQSRRTSSTPRRGDVAPLQDQEESDRIQLMTDGRTSPPRPQESVKYFIEKDGADPAEPQVFGAPSSLTSLYDEFYFQVTSLRDKTNLEVSETTPVIQVWMQDENGDIVNLNEQIFTAPPEILASENFLENLGDPSRPLASLESLNLNVEQPRVGGPTGILTGQLKIKVHNPGAVVRSHPRGKFIAWMLRQGVYLKVRYGVSGDDSGFISKTADFIISHHDVVVQENLEISLTLHLIPASDKLFNQVLIGEAIPLQELNLTEEQIGRSVQGVAAAADEEGRTVNTGRLKSLAYEIQRSINERVRYIGHSTYVDENGTLGSVLTGEISVRESYLRSQRDGINPIQIRNELDVLKSIQGSLVTQRFDDVIKKNSYFATIRSDLKLIAINSGPLVDIMVRPEIEKIARASGGNTIRFENEVARTNVSIVFGNFNSQAGEWANKPISTFPIDVDQIIARIRRNRNVGRFSEPVNAFLGMMFSQMRNRDMYSGEERSEGNVQVRRLILPEVKYRFYPDPQNEGNWIFYIYDSKQYNVELQTLLSELNEDTLGTNERKLTREEIKQKCEEKRIPWIEPGSNTSLIKGMTAQTQADDMIQSSLIYEANQSFNQRRMDGNQLSNARYRGYNQGLVTGMQDPREAEILRGTEIIMPLRVQLDHFMIANAQIFSHVYLFFPVRQFSGLYTIYKVGHEIDRSGAKSHFDLHIQITQQNTESDS